MSGLRVRFAPSPTGYLHVGGARTALFNYLLARQSGGTFVLRIEDTDVARSTQESVDAILEGMNWLGFSCDEGPIYQSDRFDLYRARVQQLLDEGKAYRCYCSAEELQQKRDRALAEGGKPKYDGTCRNRTEHPQDAPFVVRYLCPLEGETAFDDLIKGPISFENSELDDLIIQRSDGTPTYNFVVVVDDAEMRIDIVIRGDDHINNTPRQILLYQALGCPVPRFAHVPMILGADKSRLSKRHGATSVMAYRDMGYLPEAMVNYLVRLGWSHGDQEIFTMEELIEKFSLSNVGRSAGVFNPEKLLWLNAHYIKNAEPARLGELLGWHLERIGMSAEAGPDPVAAAASLKERSRTLVEMAEDAAFYYRKDLVFEEGTVQKLFTAQAKDAIVCLIRHIEAARGLDHAGIEAVFARTMEETGLKMAKIAQPARAALSGGSAKPGIYDILEVLGKEESLRRLQAALPLFA